MILDSTKIHIQNEILVRETDRRYKNAFKFFRIIISYSFEIIIKKTQQVMLDQSLLIKAL